MSRSSRARSLVSAAVLLGTLAFAGTAGAFCRTSTLGLVDGCTIGGDNCCTEGKPLYWKNACVGYSVQKAASRKVSFFDASQGITKAFAKWAGTTCPTDGTGNSRVSIDIRDLGPVECGTVKYNKTGPNQHVIVFRDDVWGHNDDDNTLALTTVTFSPESGEIFDADMEVNMAGLVSGPLELRDPVDPSGFDYESIMTHETGHFIGLAHSTDARATMFAHYKPGTTNMRFLTADDVAGICTIYPPDGTRTADGDTKIPQDVCDPRPRRGLSATCEEIPDKTSCTGSSVAGQRTGGHELAWLGAVAGLLALHRVRSRGKRSGPS